MSKVRKDRTRGVLTFALILIVLSIPMMSQAKTLRNRFVPPDGKCLMVIGAGWEKDIEKYKKSTGDTPAGVKFFCYPESTDTTYFWHCVREENPPGGVAVITLNLLRKTHGSYKPWINGEYDEGLAALGEAIKKWGGPVYVGVGVEVDLDLVHNLHDDEHRLPRTPQEFCQAFRHVHRLWDRLGVKNVAYVWHSICDGMHDPRHYDYYPGDEWVDFVGISLYEPKQINNAFLLKKFAAQHEKPMMVMESGCPYQKTHSWDDWHGGFLKVCERLDIKLISYNNWGYHPEWYDEFFCNSAFDKLPSSIGKRWGREMKTPRFLHASPDLFEKIGFGKRDSNRIAESTPVQEIKESKPTGDLLLNGKDLTGWTGFFKGGNVQVEDEFVVTSKGVLALKGRNQGYLRTDRSYQDFVLQFEWRFPRGGKESGSGSGVLLGLAGEDGWLSQGLEVQIANGNCGDFWLYNRASINGQTSDGRYLRIPKKRSEERPIGEWNTYEIRCDGSKIVVNLNGRVVNEGTCDQPISGRLGLISQGTEVEFRDVRLSRIAK